MTEGQLAEWHQCADVLGDSCPEVLRKVISEVRRLREALQDYEASEFEQNEVVNRLRAELRAERAERLRPGAMTAAAAEAVRLANARRAERECIDALIHSRADWTLEELAAAIRGLPEES